MALLRALRTLGARQGLAPREAIAPALVGSLMQARDMSGSKLFVGGLAWEMDENTLRDAFANFGEVEEAKVVFDRVTGRSRGFGFVSFTTETDAQNALQGMDGKFLGGRTIRVDYATQKDGAARGGGGGFRGGGDGGGYSQRGGEGSYGGGGYGGGF